jgi:probable HAF family extracellular repeat protein
LETSEIRINQYDIYLIIHPVRQRWRPEFDRPSEILRSDVVGCVLFFLSVWPKDSFDSIFVLGDLIMPRILFLLLAIGSCLVISIPAHAATQYIITDLGTLGGPSSKALGINVSGQVVGWSNLSTSNPYDPRAFLYSDGVLTNLGRLPDGAGTQANGINDLGEVVGQTNGNGDGFLYNNGIMTALTSPTGYAASQPTAINNNGQVAGWFYKGPNMSYGIAHAFLDSNGTMLDLGALPGTGWMAKSYANGVNINGDVVGSGDSVSGYQHAFLYSGGVMKDLGKLTGAAESYATDINDNGVVVGHSGYGGHAFIYSNNQMTDLGTLPSGYLSEAFAINNGGQVVGYANTSTSSEHAMLYRDGVMSDLNSLIDPTSGWILSRATAINDAGQIAGSGGIGGQTHAFLLTPVPEPSTLALLGIGALGVMAYIWKRRK